MKIPEIEIKVQLKDNVKVSELYKIESSKDAANVFRQIFNADTILWQEEFVMLCLNRSNAVTGFYKVSSGGMHGTVVDPKIVYTVALKSCATSLIVAHNHPSGNLKISEADRKITQKLRDSGKILEIQLLDHLVITQESYLSMADQGLLW